MKRVFNSRNIGSLVDVSAVKADSGQKEIDEMIRIVKQYGCICAAPMPWAAAYTIEALKGSSAVVTGVVGFPSGSELSVNKAQAAQTLIDAGCRELDMVMNIAAFKSGNYDIVSNDIKAVVDAAQGIPVKVILEISYLTDEEIKYGSQLLVDAGAAYVKTGTGWGNRPTTVEVIKLIKDVVGNSASIKAAGGVRTLKSLSEMYESGCDRFGLGVRTAENILIEALGE